MEESSAASRVEGPVRRESLPLGARLLGGGARGARRVAQVAGVDRAVEAAAEEAIVRALESPAVERAVVRVLQGPAVEEAMRGALDSPAVERALIEAIDSQLVDKVWQRVLASDEAQRLVERIAQAPEVRTAITSQGVGFLDDIRREIGKVARRIDEGVERIVRRVFGRKRRAEPTDCAGAFTRALAVGAAAWLVAGGTYLVSFWCLLGQTPGMSIVGIRLVAPGLARVPVRLAIRRLAGLALAAIPLGLGFAGIVFSERRRGLQDVMGHTEVHYSRRERQAPWSEL